MATAVDSVTRKMHFFQKIFQTKTFVHDDVHDGSIVTRTPTLSADFNLTTEKRQLHWRQVDYFSRTENRKATIRLSRAGKIEMLARICGYH